MDRGLLLLVAMLLLLVGGAAGLLVGLYVLLNAILASTPLYIFAGVILMFVSATAHRFAYNWFVAAA